MKLKLLQASPVPPLPEGLDGLLREAGDLDNGETFDGGENPNIYRIYLGTNATELASQDLVLRLYFLQQQRERVAAEQVHPTELQAGYDDRFLRSFTLACAATEALFVATVSVVAAMANSTVLIDHDSNSDHQRQVAWIYKAGSEAIGAIWVSYHEAQQAKSARQDAQDMTSEDDRISSQLTHSMSVLFVSTLRILQQLIPYTIESRTPNAQAKTEMQQSASEATEDVIAIISQMLAACFQIPAATSTDTSRNAPAYLAKLRDYILFHFIMRASKLVRIQAGKTDWINSASCERAKAAAVEARYLAPMIAWSLKHSAALNADEQPDRSPKLGLAAKQKFHAALWCAIIGEDVRSNVGSVLIPPQLPTLQQAAENAKDDLQPEQVPWFLKELVSLLGIDLALETA